MADHPVVAVKKALIAALEAAQATTLAGVQVSYGYPRRPELEYIHTGKGKDREQPAGAGTPRNHEVVVALHIYTSLKGRGSDEAEQRAWDLTEAVRDAIAPITQQSGVFMRPDGVTEGSDQLVLVEGGYACDVTIEVSGLARTIT